MMHKKFCGTVTWKLAITDAYLVELLLVSASTR